MEQGHVAATVRPISDTKALEQVRTKACDDMLALFAAADAEKKAIERKNTAPVQVETFEC